MTYSHRSTSNMNRHIKVKHPIQLEMEMEKRKPRAPTQLLSTTAQPLPTTGASAQPLPTTGASAQPLPTTGASVVTPEVGVCSESVNKKLNVKAAYVYGNCGEDSEIQK